MPDHVKKILNRAYLEDRSYNYIALHPEREMRLNGLGAPDEVTLVPLNKIETPQPPEERKPTEDPSKTYSKRPQTETSPPYRVSPRQQR